MEKDLRQAPHLGCTLESYEGSGNLIKVNESLQRYETQMLKGLSHLMHLLDDGILSGQVEDIKASEDEEVAGNLTRGAQTSRPINIKSSLSRQLQKLTQELAKRITTHRDTNASLCQSAKEQDYIVSLLDAISGALDVEARTRVQSICRYFQTLGPSPPPLCI